MPEYLYRDVHGHERQETHRMLYTTGIVCACGRPMHRVPQAPRVNWGGARPGGGPAAQVQQLIDQAPERRDAYRRHKEAYEREKRAIGRD